MGSHPFVEDTPAEDLLAAGAANSGTFVWSLLTMNQKRAEHGFGEHGFKHRAQ